MTDLEKCCQCGVSFGNVQKCGPIMRLDGSGDDCFPLPMACAMCFTINRIEVDLSLLKVFVINRALGLEKKE